MFALSAAAFLFYACDMPESSSPASPGAPPPYKLTQDKGGTNFTLKIDEGVTIIKAGEYAAVASIGSGADKKILNTKIIRQTLGLKTDGEVRTAITTIILPSTLETIEDYAFYGHTAVKLVRIPKSVQSIGASAFSQTGTALTLEFEGDSQLGIFGSEAFDIARIKKIRAPRYTLTKNADNTTYTLAVAEGVTTIAKGEFAALDSAPSTSRTPKIPLNTRLKGVFLLNGSSGRAQVSITAITLPSTLVTIEDYAFYNHSYVKGTLIIPKQVRSIGEYAFYYLGTDGTVQGPANLVFESGSQLAAIKAFAFRESHIGSKIPLPDQIETIEKQAFSFLIGLQNTSSFTIPEKVRSIGNLAFAKFNHNITGTLTIRSQALAKTAAHTPLGNNLFIIPGITTESNFDTVKLYKQVYCSYTETERNSIFGTGAAYTSLDSTETYTPASCSD